MKRKVLILLLVSVMLFGISAGFAGGQAVALESDFAGGEGTAENPWQIATAVQLDHVRNYLGEDNSDKHFILVEDIDLNVSPYNTGSGWVPIGDWDYSSNVFFGTFDGNGKAISGLFINRGSIEYSDSSVGLFGYTSSAVIKNVVLLEVDVTGWSYVGGLVGMADYSVITGSSVTGTVSCSYEVVGGIVGENYEGTVVDSYSQADVTIADENGLIAGGLVGENYRGSIENCYSTGSVSAPDSMVGGLVGWNHWGPITGSYATGAVSGGYNVGGLVGDNNFGTITGSYATGDVSGSQKYIGGLVGSHSGATNLNNFIKNSYARGSVSGSDYVGGLIGESSYGIIENCYATGLINTAGVYKGGLAGRNTGTFTASFYDRETTGIGEGLGAKSTAEMKDMNTFTDAGWDFVTVWGIFPDLNDAYPFLMRQSGSDDVTVTEVSVIQDITVPYGTALADVPLPLTVSVTLSDGTTTDLNVIWDTGTPAYDGNTGGTHLFNGSLVLSAEIENPDNLVAAVNVIVAASTNANLSNLSVDTGALTPDFDAEIINYTVAVGNEVECITITAILADANATMTINGEVKNSGEPLTMNLVVGDNVASVVVTAQDGETTMTYTITITRDAPPRPGKPENPGKPEEPGKPPGAGRPDKPKKK